MSYLEHYTATYDELVVITEPIVIPSEYTRFVEVTTPVIAELDTYPSEYTQYYNVTTPALGRLEPYNLGVNVSLDTFEVTSVVFRRRIDNA